MKRNIIFFVLFIILEVVLNSCVTSFESNAFVGSLWEGFYEIKDRYYCCINLYIVSSEQLLVNQYERTDYSARFGRYYNYKINDDNIIIEAENDISVTMNGVVHGKINNGKIILNNFKGEKMIQKLSIKEGYPSITLNRKFGDNQFKYTEWEGTNTYTYNELTHGVEYNVDRKIYLKFWLNNIVCLEIFQRVYGDDGYGWVGFYLAPMFVDYSITKNRITLNIKDTKISGIDNGLIYGEFNSNEIILKNFNGNKELTLKKVQY